MDTVTLRHGMHKADRVEFMYDGLHIVKGGCVTVPIQQVGHLYNLHLRGYNLTDSGDRLWTTVDLQQYIDATAVA